MLPLRAHPLLARTALFALTAASTFALSACDASSDLPTEAFKIRESVEQLQVTHAPAGAPITLSDSTGAVIQTGKTDALGSYVFRKVPAGSGYQIVAGGEPSLAHHVMTRAESAVPQSFYASQILVPGSGYITTRDGTTLSIYVTLPGPIDGGPYPTVVDYSGYSPSKPGAPISGVSGAECEDVPALCDAPNDPSAEVAAINGYATVSVNVRGTGCSGGAYDFFETMQLLDGYDVIETVAAQPWVLHNKVGMVGLSYPGISQLFVAAQQPPSLAAILPLSVIGNTATTLLPGGILNNGFALSWVTNVLDGAAPYGQGWEQGQVDKGDTVCAENQLLHGQAVDNVAEARAAEYYDPVQDDPLNPTLWVNQIQVPVFLEGGLQDEQTGPFFTALLNRFGGAPITRFIVYNGVHVDAFGPVGLVEWITFLDLYVAQKVPATAEIVRLIAPQLLQQIFNSNLTIPPDRFANYATWEEAKAAYEMEDPLLVDFERGAGSHDPGAPVGTFQQRFSAFPIPSDQETTLRLFFHADGSLSSTMPTEASASASFLLDPDAGSRLVLKSGSVWDKLPDYDWEPPVADHAISFVSDPFPIDMPFLGTSSADLYVKSNVDDADLQVNIMEIRPDGQEVYVQSGWMRSSFRKLDPSSTDIWPVPTYLLADEQPLSTTDYSLVRVPIAATDHVFRAGSRMRVTIDTPGGERAVWQFELKTFATPARHTISLSSSQASSIALPNVPSIKAPAALPPCPSLRGQPCRVYTPFTNTVGN